MKTLVRDLKTFAFPAIKWFAQGEAVNLCRRIRPAVENFDPESPRSQEDVVTLAKDVVSFLGKQSTEEARSTSRNIYDHLERIKAGQEN